MKRILFFIALFCCIGAYEADAARVKICVYDECTGEPVSGWKVTLYGDAQHPWHWQRDFFTDDSGCIDVWIAGVESACVEFGPCWNVADNLIRSTSVFQIKCIKADYDDGGSTGFVRTDCSTSAVYWANVQGCRNPTLDFCVPEGSEYCIGIEINDCRNNLIRRISPSCTSDPFDLNDIMAGLPRDQYRIDLFAGCCRDGECEIDDMEPLTNFRARYFTWNPPVTLGDVDFDWTAGPTVESLNPGDPNPGDGLLPRDGTIWQLGRALLGLDVDVSQVSGNASSVTVTVKQLEGCDPTQGTEIGSHTYNVSSTPTNIPLNDPEICDGYFFSNAGVTYVPGVTCFEACLTVSSGGCEIEECGIFQITDGCNFCYSSGESEHAGLVVAPNPVIDILRLSAKDPNSSLLVISSDGRIIYNGQFVRSINVSTWNNGLYVIQSTNTLGERFVEKIIKQ